MRCGAAGVWLRAPPECRAEGSGTHRGTPPPPPTSPPSLRHHNKLIPTLLTSHPRQSSELGARQGRALQQGTGCPATARLGALGDVSCWWRGCLEMRTVTSVVEMCHHVMFPFAGCLARSLHSTGCCARLQQEQKQEATGVVVLFFLWSKRHFVLFYFV